MCFGPEVTMALSVLSTAASALGSVRQGQAARQAGDYNAAIQRNQAIAAQQKAEFDADRERQRAASQRAAARAGFAKGGVAIEGTPLLVLSQDAEQAELDAQAIIYGGDVSAAGFRSQAELTGMEGRAAEQASFSEAGSTLLTGLGSASSLYSKSRKKS